MKKEKTSLAFGFASWAALFLGMAGFLVGLWRAEMLLSEKGYYFTILLYGLFSAVAVQKSVRDRIDGIPVSDIFYGISWASIVISIVLLAIGLINAEILPSEKGFYAFGFILALFGAISVQKNNRDNADVENKRETQNSES
ncbi:inner membrane protein YiaA [Dysgonomonas capnocytophagoides]|uniref:inner membrane protein YiaA n=1 Tax=Dysgonomonas capnocytophagoides TaxID=45254 RepID=UPI0030C81C47